MRKEKFAKHPGVIPELDLVEEDDRITHEISLDDDDLGTKQNTMDETNLFRFDPNYTKTEAEWDEIKKEILGETEQMGVNGEAGVVREGVDENESAGGTSEAEDDDDQNQIQDMTEKDLINLRRTIYLVIMSSVDFQECCHKLLKLNIREN